MNTYKHLQPEQYYIDLHDKFTVDRLRLSESQPINLPEEDSSEEARRTIRAFREMLLYFEKGDRYLKKKEDIDKWMERDRGKDKRIELAEPFSHILCPVCKKEMELISKDLIETASINSVLFLYQCSKCDNRRAFCENGEEYESKPDKCPKCGAGMVKSHKKSKTSITTTSTCSKCKYLDKYVYDLREKKKEFDLNFEADRKRFCMSEEEGREYIRAIDNINGLEKVMKDIEERKKNKEVYDKVAKLKKLPIGEIKRMMTEVLEQDDYGDLQFDKPDMGRFVSVSFTAQDNKLDRNGHDSRYKLKQIINNVLTDTNWRLMSDGVSYRMGYVSGKIRGYEGEEELLKIVK
jgi:ribosomal protein S27AE